MKQINIMRLLAISLLFVGCHKDDDTNPLALNEVNLALDGINIDTRAVIISANHPTMVSPSQRANFNLRITIGDNTATYIYNKNTRKWVPQSAPVYFPTITQPETVFFECFYNGLPDDDQSSAPSIQANDTLVGHIDNQKPMSVIDKVHLTHKNAIIEVVLSEKLMNKGDVYINNIRAFQETTQKYQIIINQSQGISKTIPFLLKDKLIEYKTQLAFPAGIHENTWHSISLILSEDLSDIEVIAADWIEEYSGEQVVKKVTENNGE
jgi:hypothetical protein